MGRSGFAGVRCVDMKKFGLIAGFLSLVCSGAGELRAQQYGLQALVPPEADMSREATRDISGGFLALRGGGADLNGLDVSVFYGKRVSSGTYSALTAGTALIGLPGSGYFDVGTARRDLAGMTIHGSTDKYYLFGGGGVPRLALLASVPVSFGDFSVIKDKKEEGRFYNLLTGVQGGAYYNARGGDFLLTPSVLLALMGGYKETYSGGVYWSNRKAGWIRPYAVLTLGADLACLPREWKLGAVYQRFFSSGQQRAMDVLQFRFALGWGGAHGKAGKPAAGQGEID